MVPSAGHRHARIAVRSKDAHGQLPGEFAEFIDPLNYSTIAVVPDAVEQLDEPASEAVERVFLDTQVFIEGNFSYTSPRFASLSQLAASGVVELIMTDLTIREIEANLRSAVSKAVGQRAAEPVLRNSTTREVVALFKKLDAGAIQEELLAQLKEYLNVSNAQIVEVKPSLLPAVLDRYFERRPPFGPGKDKAEFPDALTIEALKQWCNENTCELAIVSRDGAVKEACRGAEALHHFDDLGDYLDALLRSDHANEARATFVRDLVTRSSDVILTMAKKAFGNHGALLMNQDGEVDEILLEDLTFGDSEDFEMISLEAGRAVVELDVVARFTASITYNRQGTGTYDSEDGVMLFQDEVEESVEGDHDTRLAVEVTFKDFDTASFRVVKVSFEGEDTIKVYAHEDW
jgi:hypothetical protein